MLAPQLHLQALQKKRAASSWTYHATGFSGDDRLERDGALTGLTDTNKLTASFWFKLTGGDGNFVTFLFFGDNTVANPLWIFRAPDGSIAVGCHDSSNANVAYWTNLTYIYTTTDNPGWHHFFASRNGTTMKLYIDGVDLETDVVSSATNTPWTYSNSGAADWSFGAVIDQSAPLYAKISEFWFDTDTYIATPTVFRDSGHPADLGSDGSTGTGVVPKIYFRNPAASFGTNSGSGGDFTVKAGTLTDEDADKP